MSRLIRAELQKLLTTRMWWAMLIVMLLLIGIQLTFIIIFAGDTGNGQGPGLPALTDPGWLPIAVSSASVGNIFTMILGVIMITSEYRYQTITGTFLITPRRSRVIFGKLGAGVIVGVAFALVALITVVVVSSVAVLAAGGEVALTSNRVPQIALGVLATLSLYALFGIGLGALVRNQVAALIGAIVWAYVVESIFNAVPALQPVGKWMPGGAAAALMNIDVDTGFGVPNLLPAWAGAVVLLGYAVLFAVIANLTTTKRDIT